jgi:hypothetical protein
LAELANAFSFGGGYVNGGLTKEAMALLKNICSFDYMGAAEFEFGAVPAAFNVMAGHAAKNELVAGRVALKGHTQQFNDERDPLPGTKVEKEFSVYFLCHKDWIAEVGSRIHGFAANKYDRTKERVCLYEALFPDHEWDLDNKGWLELDNGFIFTIDPAMFHKFADVFGVKVEDEPVSTTTHNANPTT